MTEEQEEQARKGGDGDCVRASELVLVCVCVCVCVRVGVKNDRSDRRTLPLLRGQTDRTRTKGK